jgi:hypothetical protein
MSLHRYLVSPPLAIAIAPAKPHPPPRTEKKPEPQDENEDKVKQEEKKVEGPTPDPNQKADADPTKSKADGVVKPQAEPKADAQGVVPNTPGSMVPEPPTPADGADVNVDGQATPVPDTPIVQVKNTSDDTKPKPDDPIPAAQDDKDKVIANQSDETKAKPDAEEPDPTPKEPFIGPLPKPYGPEPEPELEPEPLRLIGPPPKYPIRTRLDLNQHHPWPPIESDPRGAYHHYAKGCYKGIIESVYIDVTKDGWMSEHWKEKSERDALAKLRGEDLRKARRELEWQGKLRQRRKVPKSAGEVLLMLWNLLVEAPNNEVSIAILISLVADPSYLPRHSGLRSIGTIQQLRSIPSRSQLRT